jgi:hypothetical protein
MNLIMMCWLAGAEEDFSDKGADDDEAYDEGEYEYAD